MVISKLQGRITVSIHGPETSATCKDYPEGLEWFGIDFKLGTFIPSILPGTVMDSCIILPDAAARSFRLDGSRWQCPDFDNADAFVNRLVRRDVLQNDPVVSAIALDLDPTLSLRAMQYRVVRATGLSRRTIHQIHRARYAAALLKKGMSIFDTVAEAGYSDQPHMTRSLKRFIGQTPAEIPSTPIVALHDSE